MRYAAISVALVLAICGCARKSSDMDRPGTTQTTAAQSDQPGGVDDTAVNERDRSGAKPLPMTQGENGADLETTARIRRMIVEDATFSIDARNVTIITSNGVVTLRGPVNDAYERAELVQRVARLPGVANVDNQLEVTGNQGGIP